MRIIKYIVVIAVSSALAACATKPTPENPGHDGHRLFGGSPSSAVDIEKIKSQLEQNARSSTAKAAAQTALDGEPTPGSLAIGNVGSFRVLEPGVRAGFYKKSYVQSAEKWHPGTAATMSESEFSSRVAGYTAVVVWSVPGMLSRRVTSAVFESDLPSIDFPSQKSASFWVVTGDLVVAKSNDDGVFFVTTVLCKKSTPEYNKCEAQFVRGQFDTNTGEELDKDMAPKRDGARIDVTTYKVVPKI